jgi:hypothetical protein
MQLNYFLIWGFTSPKDMKEKIFAGCREGYFYGQKIDLAWTPICYESLNWLCDLETTRFIV